MSRSFIIRTHMHAVQVAEVVRSLVVDRPMLVTIGWWEETRSLEQNAKLHAMLGEVSKQKQWAGQWLDIEDWKRLMTAAWLRTKGEGVKILPAIDGAGFDVLYQKTSQLKVKQMAELIEYVTAWMVDNEIRFYDSLEVS